MRRLMLWDIDGTLVRLGELGAVVFDRAIEVVLGKRPTARVTMSGKTDQQIVKEYLEMLAVGEAGEHVPAIIEQLESELAAAEAEIRVPGAMIDSAAALLERLARTEGVLQSVVTGNIAPNALVKLGAFDLDRFLDLDIGAFGSDHVDRDCLVPIARERAERLRAERFGDDEVWVIGDTPRDLQCARAAGVRCLLVGTGRFSYEELVPLGADATFASLADVDAVLEVLART